MNIHYERFANQYSSKLRSKGLRKKARCFWEYQQDVIENEENSEVYPNAVRFYAQSWEVSKSTAQRWLIEFQKEYKIFNDNWELINGQTKDYNKNNVGHSWDSSETKKEPQSTATAKSNESGGTDVNHSWDKDINIYNINKSVDNKFRDLFFIYSQNTKFPGKKSKALEAYKELDTDISHKDLINASVLYLHDKTRNNKHFNLANFLKEEIYLAYVPKRISIEVDGVWIKGVYNSEDEVFTSTDGQPMKLFNTRLTELFTQGKLKFLRDEV